MPPPYVLVGHSSGGLYSLYYTKTWPDEVAAIVLVDSSHPEQMVRCREEECQPPSAIKAMLKILPEEMYGELTGLEESGRQVQAAEPLKQMPLIVLSRGKEESGDQPLIKLWPELQADLAAMLPDSQHIIADKSGHFIQQDQPELVVQAVKDVLEALKQSSQYE